MASINDGKGYQGLDPVAYELEKEIIRKELEAEKAKPRRGPKPNCIFRLSKFR